MEQNAAREVAFHVEQNARALLESCVEANAFDPKVFVDPLLRFCELIEAWNRSINLTGQRSLSDLAAGLCADAVALARVLPASQQIVDLGSGAGFPGIPLAILRPNVEVTLVDSRERRHHFQRAAIRELELRNVRTILGRAERLEPEPKPVALAQAMSKPSEAIALLARWTELGGKLCLPISADADPRSWLLPTGIVAESHLEFEVLPQQRRRALWIGKRIE